MRPRMAGGVISDWYRGTVEEARPICKNRRSQERPKGYRSRQTYSEARDNTTHNKHTTVDRSTLEDRANDPNEPRDLNDLFTPDLVGQPGHNQRTNERA